MTPAQIWKAVRAVVAHVDAEEKARAPLAVPELPTQFLFLDYQYAPIVRNFARRLALVKPGTHIAPNIPMKRTTTAQESHIMCESVRRDPRALNKYIHEVNTFWTNVYRHDEEQLVTHWRDTLAADKAEMDSLDIEWAWREFDMRHGLYNELAEVDMTAYDKLSRMSWDSPSQVQIESKE